jgi:hypothetical protein
VPLEAALDDLGKKLKELHDSIDAIGIAVGDAPSSEPSAVVDRFKETVEELISRAGEARATAKRAREVTETTADLHRVRRALTSSQEDFHRILWTLYQEFLSYEKMAELARLASGRGKEWIPWSSLMKDVLDKQSEQLRSVSDAYFLCWQEIAERVGTMSVTVQVTNVGQQITARKADEAEINPLER